MRPGWRLDRDGKARQVKGMGQKGLGGLADGLDGIRKDRAG